VLVLVILLDPDLVHVPMAVGHPVVRVLVIMLDVLVIVPRVRVAVDHPMVLVLVRVGRVVRVFLGAHIAPVIVWSSRAPAAGGSGTPARRCSMWRNASSSNTAT